MNTKQSWWDFSIEIDENFNEYANASKLTGEFDGNPETPPGSGRYQLHYHKYIGLDNLLNSQFPHTRVPDERVFIITHQLYELAFKMITFDLLVISHTFHTLLAYSKDKFSETCTIEKSRNEKQNRFWQPACSSASRIKYFCGQMRAFGTYLYNYDLFDSFQFAAFRRSLVPASGFQTAQFRLIQRALGKSNMLMMRIFPGLDFGWHYEGRRDVGLVSVLDPLVLGRSGTEIADPQHESPLWEVACVDDLAHAVLNRLYESFELDTVSTLPEINQGASIANVLAATGGFYDFLEDHRNGKQKMREENSNVFYYRLNLDTYYSDARDTVTSEFTRALNEENRRRSGFDRACAAVSILKEQHSRSSLKYVLDCLIEADDILHKENGFLSDHREMAIRRTKEAEKHDPTVGEGTAGGGPTFLNWSSQKLTPMFPAMIAYRSTNNTERESR